MIRELIIVFDKNDEEIADKLYDLVMAIDDNGPDDIVGTRDNSVHLVKIEKKSWEELNTLSKPVSNKIILLDDYEYIENEKFSEYYISYGLSENKLVIKVDADRLLDNPELMKEFLSKFNDEGEAVSPVLDSSDKKKKFGKIFRRVGTTLLIGPGVIFTEKKLDEVEGKAQKIKLRACMQLYAIRHLYFNYLEEYLNLEEN